MCMYLTEKSFQLNKFIFEYSILLNNFNTKTYFHNIHFQIFNKLMKGKALRKHSMHEKTAASVLLKLFVSSNE